MEAGTEEFEGFRLSLFMSHPGALGQSHASGRFVEVYCYSVCCCSLQLGLTHPLRDQEMFAQRLRAEGAVSVHQPSSQDGGTHHTLQHLAKVRS